MGFDVLLDQAGSLGRFQILQIAFLFVTSMITYPQALLENFTAAIPGHRCWVPLLDNHTTSGNDSDILSQDALLRVSIPLDANLRPEKCRRFTHPQWQLLHLNRTFPNVSESDTEPCVDGWVYDQSSFSSTIVTKWDLVCESQSQKSVVQTVFLSGSLLGSLIFGYLSDRRLVESARWLITTNHLVEGTKALRRVAHISGKKSAGEILTLEFVRSTMQEEMDKASTKPSVVEVFQAPKLRMRVFYLNFLRLGATVPFYGLILNLQELGSSIFMFQILFGAVPFISRCIILFIMKYMDRRKNQSLFFFLAGLCILANAFLSKEMQTLRVILATLGVGAISAALTAFSVHSVELIPTICRSTITGINNVFSRIGAVFAPLLMTLIVYSPHLPWIMYGVFCIFSGLIVFCLPETRNQPLPNTIQDVEKDTKDSRGIKNEDTSLKITQF
ncbi:steroid transmembrane transporter SLC22A24-like isoform X2 [Oryctolagus cuniculus]|uniref:steroid transmembrane transporter SLC22A24-like isoform X2 n=1 Tax=Oryctolagus cuniculus TaxID=9986 RepID=UPI003879309E